MKICTDLYPPVDAYWRAYREIHEVSGMLKDECLQISRSQIYTADPLANAGRRLGEGYTGFSFPMFNSRVHV